jgi:hypothetical protein
VVGVCGGKLFVCEWLGEVQVSQAIVLVVYLSNGVDVLKDLLCLIVVEDKEASEDNNGLLIAKERTLRGQGEMLLTKVSLGIANKEFLKHGHI